MVIRAKMMKINLDLLKLCPDIVNCRLFFPDTVYIYIQSGSKSKLYILWWIFQQSRTIFLNYFTVKLSRKFAIKRFTDVTTPKTCHCTTLQNISFQILCKETPAIEN